jgi:hypothetical protein
VIRVWDERAGKHKRHICVSERRQIFLRINTDPVFKPHHPLLKVNNDRVLTHDSYVELQQLVRLESDDISHAERLGRLSQSETNKLVEAAQNADTLTPEQKRLIFECLGGLEE